MNYAQIIDGLVVNVIVADADFVAQSNLNYVRCERGGIGWTFDGTNFIAPQPYPSWLLDSDNDWQPPTPKPVVAGKEYVWFEPNKQWIELV